MSDFLRMLARGLAAGIGREGLELEGEEEDAGLSLESDDAGEFSNAVGSDGIFSLGSVI